MQVDVETSTMRTVDMTDAVGYSSMTNLLRDWNERDSSPLVLI
jgi:hypothetical protein